jgi:4a-hydroxytetrahydrobiopterin dehydratase
MALIFMRPTRYTDLEIQENLKEISNWHVLNNSISKEFAFKNFSTAFAFLTQIAMAAEKLNHHPEIKNVYNKVSIKLNTHDVGGLTELDFKLAKQIDKLLANGL